VVAVVVGHVFAVGVAHLVALKVFDTAQAALGSQYPLPRRNEDRVPHPIERDHRSCR
jgi:hypothetical protein